MTTQLITEGKALRDDDGQYTTVETTDAHYACGLACSGFFMDEAERLHADYEIVEDQDIVVLGLVLDTADQPTGTFYILEAGAWPCPDWPDYDVYCVGCGDLLHEGDED